MSKDKELVVLYTGNNLKILESLALVTDSTPEGVLIAALSLYRWAVKKEELGYEITARNERQSYILEGKVRDWAKER